MQNVPMKDGKVYSVPYLMDIMVFWVNREVTGDREIRTQEDFAAFLKENLATMSTDMEEHGISLMCTMNFRNL